MSKLNSVLLAVGLAVASTLAFATPASAATLFPCDPYGTPYSYLCTRVTSAPASGVQVYDRARGHVDTLHNGDSVVLLAWNLDDYGLCGINGDPYVWKVGWVSRGVTHWGMIGDYYLSTGSYATWSAARDSFGRLDNTAHRIPGNTNNRAYCDRIVWWFDTTHPAAKMPIER